MRILTFNHHESYLCSLATTSYEFDVITQYKGLDLSWSKSARIVPENLNLLAFDSEVKKRLKEGYYDLIICHTLKNLLWLFPYRKSRFIFIAHIPLFYYEPFLFAKSLCKKLFYQIFKCTHNSSFVAVSEFKRQSWKEQGSVVLLSPEPLENSENIEKCEDSDRIVPVVVCNALSERKQELGYSMIQELRKTRKVDILGHNPGIEGAIIPSHFLDFKKRFSAYQVYLYTIKQPYGDGYNTAMLEAMALGMAIITVGNSSSPIRHMENGLIANNASEFAKYLDYLSKYPKERVRLGNSAKKTVEKSFSSERFVALWKELIAKKTE